MWLNFLTMLRRGCWAVAALMLAWSGNAAAADINFNGGTVSNCSIDSKTYTCSSIPWVNWNDRAVVADGYTLVVSSDFSPLNTQSLIMNGTSTLKTSGNAEINLWDINPNNITSNSKTTIIAGGKFRLTSAATINGSITAATVTTNSGVTINGSIDAKTSFSLGSGSRVTGPITSPSVSLLSANSTVKGDITSTGTLDVGAGVSVTGTVSARAVFLRSSNAKIEGDTTVTGALDMESNTTITGKVSAGSLTLRAENARIYGNTNIAGDVEMQSKTSITGDLTARDVKTLIGNAIIYGNATVNSIYINQDNRVDGCITCIGAPSGDPYRCVSKPDYYSYTPRCTGSSSPSIHHFQIKHSGVGLTCQPQTVEIKACTDANCTATVSTTTKVTLSPNGGDVNVSGTTNAQVRYATATGPGGITLSATASSISNANVCPNAATGTNNCQMVFKDEGMVLNAPDHVAKTPEILLSVQALKTSAQGSCVPLVQGVTVPVRFSCGYVNPLPGSANRVPVTVAGTDLSCGSGGTDINLNFNNDGLATTSLQYGEVGQTSLTAAYTANSLGASGAVQFTTAPAKIKIEPIRINASGNFSSTAFAKASEPFRIRLTALNYKDEVTKNFGRESPTPQNFLIPSPMLISPAVNGNRPLTIGTYKGIADGIADAADGTPGQWRFDDTGTLKVFVKLDNSTGYLGNATKGFNPTNEVNLVFVPDHFEVTLQAGTPMACALVGNLKNPCGTLNASGKFIYSKQPFGLVINTYIGLKDANNNYLSPQNYVGADARPITLSARSTADRNVAIAGGSNGVGDFNWTTSPPATMQLSFAYDKDSKKNIGLLSPGATIPPSYDFRLIPTAPTTMYVRVTDSDGASSAGFAEPLLTVVTGRMAIPNISGPLTKPVPVAPSAQYWNGAAYAFNSQFQLDSMPMYTPSGTKTYYISYSKCMNGLDTSSNRSYTCPGGSVLKLAAPETIKFVNGKGLFYLAPPSPVPSRNGSLDITLRNPALEDPSNLSSDKPELIKYLPSGTGTVIFGVYRSGPIIYMREAYN